MKGSVEKDVWSILFAVEAEIERAREIHQDNDLLPDLPSWMLGPDNALFGLPSADEARRHCDESFAASHGSWAELLVEEVCEALEEEESDRLRAELVQVAAITVGWIQAIDRRAGSQPLLRVLRSDEER